MAYKWGCCRRNWGDCGKLWGTSPISWHACHQRRRHRLLILPGQEVNARQCYRFSFFVFNKYDSVAYFSFFCVHPISPSFFKKRSWQLSHMFSSLKRCTEVMSQPFLLKVKVTLEGLMFVSVFLCPLHISQFFGRLSWNLVWISTMRQCAKGFNQSFCLNTYQSCSNYAPGVKIDPAPGVTYLHWII